MSERLSPSRDNIPRNAATTTEDGLLSAYEIFNSKFKADLVLSACEIGLGKELNNLI